MRPLYLYRVSQDENRNWDTFDSFVVAAYSSSYARKLAPRWDHDSIAEPVGAVVSDNWAKTVRVELVGTAAVGIKPGQVICSSYNAG